MVSDYFRKNKKLILYTFIMFFFLFSAIFFQFQNLTNRYIFKQKSEIEIKLSIERDLLKVVNNKIIGKSLSEMSLLNESKIYQKKNPFIIFYLPTKICFTCAEDLLRSINKIPKLNNNIVIVIDKLVNPLIRGLIKYNRLQDLSFIDYQDIFLEKIFDGILINKPVAFIIRNNRFEKSFIIYKNLENEIKMF